MFRLSKLTDYGFVLLAHMTGRAGETVTAPELAEATALPQPTVAKTLKALAKAGVVVSHRGVGGGYSLDRAPDDISVAEIISAMEGPVALTACVEGAEHQCDVESCCPMRGHWDSINHAVKTALEGISLADVSSKNNVPDFINMDQPAPSFAQGS
ncbi:SUF system Fe-S cluster assembly regulator [Aestuariispira insulae]|uniref:BadM/Rrf2 family transcriptional regulator n=1 Tax=Aestuariispira insulae TaxID=1461337 RepID=A0A3D9HTY5_9PROT|nr:SUF system Fe-S cluster assembly regulator [Aestuariispira insulae]RED52336.1 BadM/Rrf2 family transcriptional regulator [Aestuariispira insulae]